MRRLIALIGTVLVSTYCFADISSSNLKSLGTTWKGSAQANPQEIQNDITIVYGGEDVSRKPYINSPSTTA